MFFKAATNHIQLTAFCWNVHDGRLPEKELSDAQRERAIKGLPGILDYAGYVVRQPPRTLTAFLMIAAAILPFPLRWSSF